MQRAHGGAEKVHADPVGGVQVCGREAREHVGGGEGAVGAEGGEGGKTGHGAQVVGRAKGGFMAVGLPGSHFLLEGCGFGEEGVDVGGVAFVLRV